MQRAVGHCCGEELGHYVDQCWLQALQFLLHLINLLNILLRCNGFTRIQKAVVDQTSSKASNSDHDPFFDASLPLGSVLELLLGATIELVFTSCHIKVTLLLHITILLRNGSLLCRKRENDTLKQGIFDLRLAYETST